MAEHHWNKLQKRLKNIIDPRLNISFNNSPARKNTSWGEITIRFFQVKLDKKLFGNFQKIQNKRRMPILFMGNIGLAKENREH